MDVLRADASRSPLAGRGVLVGALVLAGLAVAGLWAHLSRQAIWFALVTGSVVYVVAIVSSVRAHARMQEANRYLEESQGDLTRVLDTAAEGILGFDHSGRIQFANAAACRMLGWAVRDLVGRRGHALIHHSRPDGSPMPESACGMFLTLRDGQTRSSDREVLWRRDGTSFPAEYVSTPIEQNDRVAGAVLTFSDISERLRSEHETRRLAAIVEGSDDAIIGKTLEGVITSWNAGAERLYGYAQEEAIGRSVRMLEPSDRADEVTQLLERVGRGEGIIGLETERMRSDGTRVEVSLSHSPVRDGDGRVIGVSTIARDVSERRRAEEALRQAEERFRSAFESAPIGMGLLGLDGRWLRANQSLSDLTGWSVTDLLSRTMDELVASDDLVAYRAAVGKLVAGAEDSFRSEMRLVHAQSHDVWVRAHVSVVRGADGRPLHLISQVEDITQRKQSEMMLTHIAMHDHLTGLPNRMLALDRLGHALARSARTATDPAVFFLDLDRFKVVNDSLGHAAGDRLLVAAGQRLTTLLRPSDTVARIGGDEFVVVCEDVGSREGAERIAQRIIDAIAEPFELGSDDVVLGTSVGVALASTGSETPDDLIRDADAAMYRAKEGGRNRFEVFDTSMRDGVVSRLKTEQSLRRALERGELELHYQPLIDLDDGGAITGVEALVRWQHPERGLIPPADFIPLAEETGLIVPIGEWVLRQACRQAAAWRHDHPDSRPLRVAVNLSARQLAQPNLTAVVASILRETDSDPSQIVLEITESVLTDDQESTVEALRSLKALGVRLSVDDFGTGYSSLLYLKRFPVDILKVDRSFVEGLGTDPEDSAIVAGVVGLAKTLGLTTVAEGVETEQQLSALRDLGCQHAQGYLFARPAPPARLELMWERVPAA